MVFLCQNAMCIRTCEKIINDRQEKKVDNYILMNDMVQAHEERMMHLKRYYPFFRLMDSGLSQYRDGAYERLDMSYIVLAVLRFFIEANHFHDQPVYYEDYRQFMAKLLVRDFDFTE